MILLLGHNKESFYEFSSISRYRSTTALNMLQTLLGDAVDWVRKDRTCSLFWSGSTKSAVYAAHLSSSYWISWDQLGITKLPSRILVLHNFQMTLVWVLKKLLSSAFECSELSPTRIMFATYKPEYFAPELGNWFPSIVGNVSIWFGHCSRLHRLREDASFVCPGLQFPVAHAQQMPYLDASFNWRCYRPLLHEHRFVLQGIALFVELGTSQLQLGWTQDRSIFQFPQDTMARRHLRFAMRT